MDLATDDFFLCAFPQGTISMMSRIWTRAVTRQSQTLTFSRAAEFPLQPFS